tara:strand:+ start:7105 stop:9612 length:2508 start_codon:yes stop_codon:yes gene_type:complete
MPKIHKVYPPFYNGVSQQNPELILDNQCKEMVNCIPSVVEGLLKRPPVNHQTTIPFAEHPEFTNGKVFHTYDRGEDNEEYIFIETSDYDNPVQVFNLAGEPMVVEFDAEHATTIKDYLANSNLKALTVQDRTWMFSREALVGIDTTNTFPLKAEYTREAYFWLKRGSGDRYNPYNYAVYLDGVAIEVNPNKPSIQTYDPATGYEDSDYAAAQLGALISGASTSTQETSQYLAANQTKTVSIYIGAGKELADPANSYVLPPDYNPPSSFSGQRTYSLVVTDETYDSETGFYTVTLQNTSQAFTCVTASLAGCESGVYNGISMTFTYSVLFAAAVGYVAEVKGSLIKITREDGGDFEFSSWDSWGNQASIGWKESVNKITDLPKDHPFADTYVKITGEEQTTFTDYFVKWNGSSWEETLDPEENRGVLTNMPIKLDRTALAAGVATFTFDIIDWSPPRVGNLENNPNPSFAPDEGGLQRAIQDMFFYKNRLGIASDDSIVLSETANYTNFYISSVVSSLDTDVIDVTVATNQASKIHFTKPFNNSLYIFTKYAQYELVSERAFGPNTVSLVNTSNYPMAIDVEPVVVNDSLYFISTTNNRQQLRQYIKSDNLNIIGIDLNVSTPTYLVDPVRTLIVDGVLGYIVCTTDTNEVYLYNFKEDGTTRIQSAWSKWTLLNGLAATANSFEYHGLSSNLLVHCKTATDYRYHRLQLDSNVVNGKIDTSSADNVILDSYNYTSSVKLPDYYPKMSDIRSPKHKLLIKKVTIEGEGQFDAEVYRKDYNTTYTKSHNLSLKDLDLTVASRVGNVDITIIDTSENDFKLTSVIVEGMLTVTSKEMK